MAAQIKNEIGDQGWLFAMRGGNLKRRRRFFFLYFFSMPWKGRLSWRMAGQKYGYSWAGADQLGDGLGERSHAAFLLALRVVGNRGQNAVAAHGRKTSAVRHRADFGRVRTLSLPLIPQ